MNFFGDFGGDPDFVPTICPNFHLPVMQFQCNSISLPLYSPDGSTTEVMRCTDYRMPSSYDMKAVMRTRKNLMTKTIELKTTTDTETDNANL